MVKSCWCSDVVVTDQQDKLCRRLLLIKSASSVGAGHSSNSKPNEDDLSVGGQEYFPRCFGEVCVCSE
jgi:hypothetical protein